MNDVCACRSENRKVRVFVVIENEGGDTETSGDDCSRTRRRQKKTGASELSEKRQQLPGSSEKALDLLEFATGRLTSSRS